MRILFLSHLYPPHHAGSFDLSAQNLVELLAKRGHVLHVLTSNHGVGSGQRDAELDRVLWLNDVHGHPRRATLGELRPLEVHNQDCVRECLERFQPDVVLVWSLAGLSKGLIFGLRTSKRPVAYHVADPWLAAGLRQDPWLRWWNAPRVGAGAGCWRGWLELLGERARIDRRAPTRMMVGPKRMPDVFGPPATLALVPPGSVASFRFYRIFFCSAAMRDAAYAAGFMVAHGEVIPPGIRTEAFFAEVKPLAAPVRRYLISTRLTESSGVLTAMEALRLARGRGLRLSLSIHGRGESDYVAKVRSFAVQRQLPVEFPTVGNTVKDLAALYRQHDVFLHPIEADEGFNPTPLEAMASGLPVIATTLGGAAGLLRQGENAFLYTPGEAGELASRFQELDLQPALRQQMAETAQAEIMSQFNETSVTDRIERFLEETVQVWQHQ